MKQVIVTGPTGAIGIALINKLIKEDIQVFAICRPKSKRIKYLPESPLLKIVECDISNLSDLKQLVNSKCDVFYHFAWLGTVGTARNDMYLQTLNIQYTLDAVEVANKLGCNTFIGAGSQAEYGRSNQKLRPDTPVKPENGYGMAKLCAGQMSRIVCKRYGIRHIWPRILSVYGPYDGQNTMILSAMKALIQGDTPSFTKGEQKWDYLYSKDAGNIMYLLAKKGIDQKVYCLGSGNAKPLKEYIQILQKCVSPNAKVNMGGVPYAENQVMYLCADISDIQKDLGYECKYSFDEGIKETFQWFKKEMGNEED